MAFAALPLIPIPAAPVHAASVLAVPAAYPTIQAAINAAQSGDTVSVTPGTYGAIDFKGKAVRVQSTAGPAVTVIDAANQGIAVTFASGEGSGAVLQGFTVERGSPASAVGGGGGVNIVNASPMVIGNIITANAACGGNGIAVLGAATIENNWIAGNRSPRCSGARGGGIAISGSGARIIGNVITDNSADAAGGGIEMNGTDALVRGNIITGNLGGSEGGGIDIINQSSSTIADNLITHNEAVTGGGIESLAWSGSTGPVIAGNTVAYNTVIGSSGPTGAEVVASGYADKLVLVDNILLTDTNFPALYCDATWDSAPPTVTFNDLVSRQSPSGGLCSAQTGSGNISKDPQFVGPAASDFHLSAGSPAIDAGTVSDALTSTDLDGGPRTVNGAPDLGAYEWSSSSPLPTTTTVVSTTTSPSVGATTTIAVAATPVAGGPVRLGRAPFFTLDGAAPPSCSVLDAPYGWGTCAIRLTSAGPHTVQAAFSGWFSYGASSAPPLTITVAQGTTTTALSPSNSPGGAGQPIQLTAQVGFSSDQGNHAGTVAFTADGAPITGCSAQPLNAGSATCSVTYPNVGAHDIVATYSGSADFAASGSSTLHENVEYATTTALGVAPSSSTDGQSVTLTATVSRGAAPGTLTGTVAFADAGAPLSGCASVGLSGAMATCTVTLAAGTHALTSSYSGDPGFGSSTSASVLQTVAPLTTWITLTSDRSSAYVGMGVVLDATVSGDAPAAPVPTGRVTFSYGSNVLGSAALDGVGHVRFLPPILPTGTWSLTAAYPGDAHHAPSSGSTQVQILPLIPTEVSLATATSPSVPGQRVWVGIAVDPPDGSLNGTFTISVNGALQGTGGLLADGTRSWELDSLPTGTNTISVTYQGDQSHSASTASLTQRVVPASADQRFVNQLYNDVLGRDADATAASWAQALDRGTVSRGQVALALTTSTEYLSGRIQGQYLGHLGRTADPKGLQYWLDYLRKGATLEDLEISFLSTAEYYANAGGAPDAFLHTLYQDVLGRDVDPNGLRYWVGKLTTGTPFWVVAASVVKSTEAMSNRVTDDYRLLLNRDPDPQGLGNWVSLLQHGTRDETLLGDLAGSLEYWNDTQSY